MGHYHGIFNRSNVRHKPQWMRPELITQPRENKRLKILFLATQAQINSLKYGLLGTLPSIEGHQPTIHICSCHGLRYWLDRCKWRQLTSPQETEKPSTISSKSQLIGIRDAWLGDWYLRCRNGTLPLLTLCWPRRLQTNRYWAYALRQGWPQTSNKP